MPQLLSRDIALTEFYHKLDQIARGLRSKGEN